jgi:hypothetical protein
MNLDLLMQLQPIKHAMLDINPDEIRLRARNHLSNKSTRNTVCNAHQCLTRIGLCIFEGLAQVPGLDEGGSAVGRVGVESGLLAVGCEV